MKEIKEVIIQCYSGSIFSAEVLLDIIRIYLRETGDKEDEIDKKINGIRYNIPLINEIFHVVKMHYEVQYCLIKLFNKKQQLIKVYFNGE